MATQTVAVRERRRFSADDFRKMMQAGILAPDEGIALRDGALFRKSSGTRRRFNVDEYYALAEAGILDPDARVELWDGEIVTMAAMGNRHIFCRRWLSKALFNAVGDSAVVDMQLPLMLDTANQPGPDFAILRWRDDRYMPSPKAGPEDTLLVIEVSDTTAGADRRYKALLYAAQGIPEMWLFDLNNRQVEIYDEPGAGGYARMRVVGIDGVLTPGALPHVGIPVKEVMPD